MRAHKNRKGNPKPPAKRARLRYVTCEQCDKRGYFSMADAKKAKKSMNGVSGGQSLKPYPCLHNEGMYHLGRFHGFKTRESVRNYHLQQDS